MHGRSRISGHDSFMPSRTVTVAKSYVEGLENVRDRYQSLQADHMRLNHEAITLAANTLVLHRILTEMLVVDEGLLTELLGNTFVVVAGEVLDNAEAALDGVFQCPCGHSLFEHDEEGCNYLQCRLVCA